MHIPLRLNLHWFLAHPHPTLLAPFLSLPFCLLGLSFRLVRSTFRLVPSMHALPTPPHPFPFLSFLFFPFSFVRFFLSGLLVNALFPPPSRRTKKSVRRMTAFCVCQLLFPRSFNHFYHVQSRGHAAITQTQANEATRYSGSQV